ncbi:hypothetical protein ACFYN9_21870 [Streptomyces collinus]|uniref:hypothetical protein n=1 Tax=Streptomyces collinus TaxID=42684 RepID=UPI0036B87816
MNVTDFAYLWTAPPGKYVLQKFIVEGEEQFLIYSPGDESAVLIEDDELNAQVARKMIAAGVEIVEP